MFQVLDKERKDKRSILTITKSLSCFENTVLFLLVTNETDPRIDVKWHGFCHNGIFLPEKVNIT